MQDDKSQQARVQREKELQAKFRTPDGHAEVFNLFVQGVPAGTIPPAGTLIIQTILDREFGTPAQ
jgi:hypothetical protein